MVPPTYGMRPQQPRSAREKPNANGLCQSEEASVQVHQPKQGNDISVVVGQPGSTTRLRRPCLRDGLGGLGYLPSHPHWS
jgi:hypothetical protein